MTIILETKQPILRHQVIEDLGDLRVLYQNPNITKYIPAAPRSRAKAQEELEWHMHRHPKNPELGLWATIHKETGKFKGDCFGGKGKCPPRNDITIYFHNLASSFNDL